ncbi:transposase, IS4 family protein [mine drainage metagenome]|uniref:Transposase, IS4 family protein n=3 Tax=mine drainage metagenome TaxID=410659 RepID=T1CH56_9ZZZZ
MQPVDLLWATQECGGAEFGDKRLTPRFIKVAAALAAQPTASIPLALQGWGETKGGYRLFDNPKVTPNKIIAAHAKATVRRVQGQNIILVAQDTMAVSFNSHDDTQGLGPIGPESSRGLFVHSCLAGRIDGTPLGLLHQKMWARTGTKEDEEKESARWIEAMRAVKPQIPDGTRLVMVGDRENDFFGYFAAVAEEQVDAIVRAAHDRKLQGQHPTLAAALAAAPPLGTLTVTVPRKPDQPEREASLTLFATTVELPPTTTYRGPHKEPVRLNAVCAYEIDAPQEVQNPIRWVLLTTLPVADAEQAAAVVRWYSLRWRIERFHYTLKSGCQIENLQLQTERRLENAIATYSIAAWRILWLTYEARQNPDAPCTSVLSDIEWKAIVLILNKNQILKGHRAPSNPPSLSTAVIYISRLGGFLARKGDGDPGVKVLWRGWRRLQDMVTMLQAAEASGFVGKG